MPLRVGLVSLNMTDSIEALYHLKREACELSRRCDETNDGEGFYYNIDFGAPMLIPLGLFKLL
jgi:hypothetical protein